MRRAERREPPVYEPAAHAARLAAYHSFFPLKSRANASGRVPVVEILKASTGTRECVETGEHDGRNLLDSIKAGGASGMQHFDGELEKLLHSGTIDLETALSYASHPQQLRQMLEK